MSDAPPKLAWLEAYADAWEDLAPESLDTLVALLDPEVRFVDPFNDLKGRPAVRRMLQASFVHLREPRFLVTDRSVSERAGYLRWRMTARSRRGGLDLDVQGMTEVQFSAAGLVSLHLDHWDAAGQFYEKLPLLGGLLRVLRRRLAA